MNQVAHSIPYDMPFFVFQPRTQSIVALADPSPTILLPSCHLMYHANNGLFEASLIEWISENFTSTSKIFVDVGAHTGTWSAMLAGHFKAVNAFEPHPETFHALAGTVAMSGLKNVVVHNKALGSKCTSDVALYSSTEDRGSTTLIEPTTATERVLVDMITLDSLSLDDVGLIKVDTEGSELDVLLGAIHTIRKCEPIIVFEDNSMQGSMPILTEIGYNVNPIRNYPNMFIADKRATKAVCPNRSDSSQRPSA